MSESTTDDWRNEETLEELLDNGLSVAEIAEEHGDEETTPSMVARRIQELGLDGRMGPRYTTNRVPIYTTESTMASHPIPSHIVEQMDYSEGTVIRFVPQLVGGSVELVFVTSETVQTYDGGATAGIYSNERALTYRAGYHLTVRYPNQLAAHLGLDQHGLTPADDSDEETQSVPGGGNPTGRRAMFSQIGDSQLSVRYDPAVSPVSLSPAVDGDVGTLEPFIKPLTPMKGADVPLETQTVEKYRFDIATDYATAYNIEKGQKVPVRYGSLDGEPAIALDVGGITDGTGEAAVREVQHYEAGNYDAEAEERSRSVDQYTMYPGKTILHAHGIAVGTCRPKVKVTPCEGAIALQPVGEDAYGDPVEADPLRPDLGMGGNL